MMSNTTLSYLSLSYTLSDDVAHRITETPEYFYELDVTCVDNPIYIGDGQIMSEYLNVGDTKTFKNVNARDISIKNFTAGSNGGIVASGTTPNYLVKEKLGI